MSEKRTARRTAKRASILEAAAEVFRAEGFDVASMDRIAERAGASKRTVYNHFGSKEALFRAVAETYWARSQADVSLSWDSKRTVDAQLADFAASKTRMAHDPEQLGLLRVVLGAFIQHPELAQQTAIHATVDESALVRWLIAADAAGALRVPDPRSAAAQFWALVKGVGFWPKVFGWADTDPAAMRDAIQTFLCRYRA
jgi:TetR/AcrR family transcriptional regulator of autoinduction and epiphytic fitness